MAGISYYRTTDITFSTSALPTQCSAIKGSGVELKKFVLYTLHSDSDHVGDFLMPY